MLTDIIYVGVGLAGLYFGGDWLVKGAARLAQALGISALIIGLTVVAIGTSMPELVVGLQAAAVGSSDITLGNVVGSNIANIGLILALTALVLPLRVDWPLIRREIGFMIGFSALLLLLSLDGEIGRLDGAVLIGGFVVFTALTLQQARAQRREIEPELMEFEAKEKLTDGAHPLRAAGLLAIGLVVLIVGAQFIVEGAVGIARELGVGELLIGLTLVAVGTSLPELSACVMAALRRENDIVIGNIVGSNISNILLILGGVGLLQPIPVSPSLVSFEMIVMLVFAILTLPLALRGTLQRIPALGLLAAYVVFIFVMFNR